MNKFEVINKLWGFIEKSSYIPAKFPTDIIVGSNYISLRTCAWGWHHSGKFYSRYLIEWRGVSEARCHGAAIRPRERDQWRAARGRRPPAALQRCRAPAERCGPLPRARRAAATGCGRGGRAILGAAAYRQLVARRSLLRLRDAICLHAHLLTLISCTHPLLTTTYSKHEYLLWKHSLPPTYIIY